MDIRLGQREAEGTPWSVLADVAITIVLVLIVFIVLQFMQTFRERAINAEMASWQHELRRSIRSAVSDSMQVRVDSVAPDRQRLVFSSEILFETCRANLKPAGLDLLKMIGAVIGARSSYLESVMVEGHTDRQPIREARYGCPYQSNWELSSARATRVVTLFSSEKLVEDIKLSAVGRAEFHPVDTTQLDPNRRIELILQYDRTKVLAQFGDSAKASTTLRAGTFPIKQQTLPISH